MSGSFVATSRARLQLDSTAVSPSKLDSRACGRRCKTSGAASTILCSMSRPNTCRSCWMLLTIASGFKGHLLALLNLNRDMRAGKLSCSVSSTSLKDLLLSIMPVVEVLSSVLCSGGSCRPDKLRPCGRVVMRRVTNSRWLVMGGSCPAAAAAQPAKRCSFLGVVLHLNAWLEKLCRRHSRHV